MIELTVVALVIAAAISVLIESSNITLIQRARERRAAETSKAGEVSGRANGRADQ
jgi:hypothetical protein